MNERAIKDVKNILVNTSKQYRSKWMKAWFDYTKFLDENSDEERIRIEGTKLKDDIEYYKDCEYLFLHFANQLEEGSVKTTIGMIEAMEK